MKASMVWLIIMLIIPAILFAETTDQLFEDPEIQLELLSGRYKVEVLNKLAVFYFDESSKKSLEYSRQALKLARKLGDSNGEANALSNIGYIYDKTGKASLALDYYQNALKVFIKADKRKKVDDKRTKAIIIICSIIIFLIILIISYKYYKYQKITKRELIRKNEIEKSLQLESKLKLYQARINPHFLFNSLDTLTDIEYEKNPIELKKTVKRLSNVYRSILDSPAVLVTSLKEELDVVRDYLEIEKRILNGRFNFNIYVEDDMLSSEILPLTILTLVENAVIHGICKKEEGGEVNIDIFKDNDKLVIKITDSGVGIDENHINTGFGLYSIQERLKLFYENKARFSLNALIEGGTQAVMEIPYARFQSEKNHNNNS